MANEVVPRLFYEEKEQECIAKEEQIQVNIRLEKSFSINKKFFFSFLDLKC